MDECAEQDFDYVLTVCDNAKDNCPVFFGKATRLHHNFNDPLASRARRESGWLHFRMCMMNCTHT